MAHTMLGHHVSADIYDLHQYLGSNSLKMPVYAYTCVSKKMCHFYFYDNFGTREPIFMFFTVKTQKASAEKGVKTATSPQICCCITLRNIRGQLFSFTLILARIMLHVIRYLFHELLFVCLFSSF